MEEGGHFRPVSPALSLDLLLHTLSIDFYILWWEKRFKAGFHVDRGCERQLENALRNKASPSSA